MSAAALSAAGSPDAGRRVTVIDAGVGNLGNLERALTHLGAAVEVTCEPRRIAAARCLVLPGVGAFAPPRETLRGAMEEAVGAALAVGAWLLGICVGFQLLFEAGEEFGVTDGLGLLPGRVRRLPAGVQVPHIGWNRLHDLAAHPLLAGLEAPAGLGVPDVPSVPSGPGVPAVPSASAVPRLPGVPNDLGVSGLPGLPNLPGVPNVPGVPGVTKVPGVPDGFGGRLGPYVYFVHSYAPEGVPAELCLALATHGRSFVAVAGRGRVLGTQFHPERSGAAGLKLLANFLEIADGSAAGD